MLVGNKKDSGNDREVSQQEGMELSGEMNCSFHEISAKGSYQERRYVYGSDPRDHEA